MIEFNCLIHKKTGAVISYEDWLQCLRDYKDFKMKLYAPRDIPCNKLFNEIDIIKVYEYNAREILFLDDFEIVYDSEFTTEELDFIRDKIGECERLQSKVSELIKEREYIENKYEIEI